jgi:cellulose synthase operon protein C
MHIRNFIISVLTAIFAICILSNLAVGTQFFDAELDSQIKQLLEKPNDPSSIIRLYEMDGLKYMATWDGRVAGTYRKVLENPDVVPEIKSHVLWFLARQEAKADNLDEIEKKLDALGFITDWMVIGPFDNEGKTGFDAVYPPETELNLDAKYDGKERQAAWRKYPPISRFKYIDLDAIFVPETNVAAYALTFIRSESEQDIAFRFGSDDAIKIWIDGALLYSDDGYHSAAFDQTSAGVKLHKGWNKVLLKVTQGDGGWGFMFRVTKPDGSPAEGISANASSEEIPSISKECVNRTKVEPVEVYDTVRELKKITEENPEDAQAQANVGLILNRKSAFDSEDKEDLKAFEKAIQLNPNERSFYMYAAPLYPDRNKSRQAWEKVAALDSRYAPAFYNLGNYYSRAGMPKKAVDYYQKAIAADPTYYLAKIALGEYEKQFGRPGKASKIFENLMFEYVKIPYFAIGLSARTQNDDETLELCKKYLEYDYSSVPTRQSIASIYMKRGETEKAVEQWQIIYEINPASVFTLLNIAKHYADTMQFDKAREAVEKILAICPENPSAHQLAGMINHWKGDDENAVVSWNTSLAIMPQNRNLKEYIEYLRPKEKPFEDAYKADVAELLKKFNPSLTDYPDDSSIFLLEQTVFEVHSNGLYNRFGQQVVKILQKKGTDDFKYRHVVYSPGEEDVDIQAAKIYKLDAEGNITKVINAAGPFEQGVSGDSAAKLYYNVMARIHVFNNLEIGDVIEYTYRLNQVAAKNLYADYFGNIAYVQNVLPKKDMRLIYITPAEKKFHYKTVGAEKEPEIAEQDGKRIYTWNFSDVAKIKTENMMPGLAEVSPYIHISTFEDWKKVADWYWGLVQDQFILDNESKKVVKELIAGKENTLDKVRAIHNWVVQNTRYIGLEFGIHGHKPYKAYQVFSRKYGDCKDKATLLISMLAEAGIPADVIIIRTRTLGDIDPFPASLAVFNHAICYVPELDLYLDGTAEYSGTSEFPYADQGAPVMVVSKDKREFRKTPVLGPETNINNDAYNIALDEDGGILIEGRRDLKGQLCAYYRRQYQEEKTRKQTLEKNWRQNVPNAEIQELEFSDLKDIEKDVYYTYRIKAPNFAEKNDDGSMLLKSFFGGYELTKTYASLSERKYDLVLDFPWVGTKTMKYKLPNGYKVTETPENFHQDAPFASCDITYEKGEQGIAISMKLVIKTDRIPVAQYQEFRKFCELLDEKQNEKIRIAK